MDDMPHSQIAAEVKYRKYHQVMNLHHELASLYRSKSTDRKTIARLWAAIDTAELELTYMGVEL